MIVIDFLVSVIPIIQDLDKDSLAVLPISLMKI